ncbi:hypothetical protein WG66_015875 [Moniliophthora roreri]|nr:hypothetical protein WG66_015875 [Moniliophthora roreri]
MDVTIPSSSNPQNFVNHLTPDSFLNTNPTSSTGIVDAPSNETPAKRRPGRPKGSGKKDPSSTTPQNGTPTGKRPVGRPRKDGLPAGSAGPSRPRKSAASDISDASTSLPTNHNLYSSTSTDGTSHGGTSTTPRSNSFPIEHDWAELARTKPTMFLTALLLSLSNMPSVPATSSLTVEEAFKSHLVSLAPTPSQNHHIPSLYSILKTFWLPSSPAYFALTASTSTARTPSDHRFLYWDPQPLVFNGISCPNCSSPLSNQGRIKSGPIKIYDIERPFFIIGCEYVCKSTTCMASKNSEGRKYASTDPSILRSLPTKLKDEFPARLVNETDSGSGPDVWNWNARGVSKLLWNLVRNSLKAGLQKDGIMELLWNVQRGYPGDEDKKMDDHEDSSHSGNATNGNGYSNGTYSKAVQQGSGGFTDAYNNAWRANTAVVGARDSITSTATISSTPDLPPIVPSSTPSLPTSSSQNSTPVFPHTYTPSVYTHSPNSNFTSYQFTPQDFTTTTVSPKIHHPSASAPVSSANNPPPNPLPTIIAPTTLVSSTPGTPVPSHSTPVNASAHLPNTNGNSNPAPSELGTKRPYPFGPPSLGDTSDFQPLPHPQGLKYVSKNRRQRIEALASELASSEEYDIIALQEIWVFADYQHVRKLLESVQKVTEAEVGFSGALGSGLAIFSRFPIIGSGAHPYSLNGQPIDVAGGDWFVGKAAVSVILQHPVLGHLQVFNTHFYAKGGEDGPEHFRAHRLINAWEFAKLVKQAASMGRYIITLGDYNSIPTSLPMALIREYTGVSDSWLVTHPYGNPSPDTIPTPEEAIEKYGMTADSPLCSWSAGKPLGGHALQYGGKRLDYCLYRPPMSHSAENLPTLRATDCRVTLRHNVPGTNMSFSDHFALRATLEIVNYNAGAAEPTTPFGDTPPHHAHESSQDAWSDHLTDLSQESITTTIQALAGCYRFAKQRSQNELYIFGLCIFILVVIIVGSAFFPHPWINPIFILLTIALSWLGTTMLYEGFLYGNWERNALMNVIEELEIYKSALEIQSGSSSSRDRTSEELLRR